MEFPSTFDFSDSGHNLSTDFSGNIVVNIGSGSSYTIPGSSAFNVSPEADGFHYYVVRSPIAYTTNFQGPAGQVVHVREDFSEVYNVGFSNLDQAFNATRIFPAPLDDSFIGGSGTPVETGSFSNVLLMDADFIGFGQGGFDLFPSNGPVTHIVDENSRIIVNVTMDGHALHPGLIVRHVFEDENGVIWVETLGTGVGPQAAINIIGADGVWTNIPDGSIRSAILSGTVPVELFGNSNVDAATVFPLIQQFQNASEAERTDLLAEYFEENPELFNTDTIAILFDLLDADSAREVMDRIGQEQCFGAGTPIDMWPLDTSIKPGPDGVYDQEAVSAKIWKKPIELIEVGDIVVSFDDTGNMVPGHVPRTFQNEVKILLNFFGTLVTPGHVYYRADSKNAHKFETLIDILRDDGVIQHQDGTLIRAATNVPVGEPRDGYVKASTGTRRADGSMDEKDQGRIRLGTRFIVGEGKNRKDWAVADVIEHAGGVVGDDEMIRVGDAPPMAFHWEFGDTLPKPEDFVLEASGTTLEDIYKAAEWEDQQPQMPAPMVMDGGPVQPLPHKALNAMPRNEPLSLSPTPAAKPRQALNRKQRKAIEARQRKAGKTKRMVS